MLWRTFAPVCLSLVGGRFPFLSVRSNQDRSLDFPIRDTTRERQQLESSSFAVDSGKSMANNSNQQALHIITDDEESLEGKVFVFDDHHDPKDEALPTPVAVMEAAPPLGPTDSTIHISFCQRLLSFAWNVFQAYDFPILLLAFIGIAKAAPEFGAVHVAPQYTATWIAVALIFCKCIAQVTVFNSVLYHSRSRPRRRVS